MSKPSTGCQQVRALLDIVASDTIDGLSVEENYPAVFQHLESCPTCAQAYSQLVDALQRESAGTILRAPNQPPPVPVGNGWSLSVKPPGADTWHSLTCTISSTHLEALLCRPPLPAGSRQGAPAGQLEWLLLADVVRQPAALIAVQVLLTTQWSSPEQMTLSLDISSDHPVPLPLQACLTWGEYQASLPIQRDGRVRFEAIPASIVCQPIPGLSLALIPPTAESLS